MKSNLIAIFILCAFLLSAQETEEPPKKTTHQIGVNTTFFFKQFLNFSDNTITPVSPYIITYSMLKEKSGLRLGVGGSYSSSREEDDDIQFVRRTIDGTFDFRLGWQVQKKISKRWLLFFGIDAITLYEKEKVTTEQINFPFNQKVTTESKTTGFGFGPVLGIQINIRKIKSRQIRRRQI